jgi:RND family efflux transporter MFP subunit
LQLLRWGMTWLEHALTSGAQERRDAAELALDAVSLVSRDAPPAVTGHLLCNFLADRFACSRVAFGRAVGLQVRALSLSHQVRFDRRMTQVGQLERAMEECVDQGRNIVLPAQSTVERGLTQAHEQLLLDNAQGSVCSVPLLADDRSIGALTLIRDDQAGFDATTLAQLAAMAGHIAPIFELKQREAQGAGRKILHALGGATGRLIGAGHMRLKILVAAGLIAVAALTWVQTDLRVTATSAVEGALQQTVVAPFDGYVTRADARAGDQVEEGQLLAMLDDRELLLEREKWSSERAKHGKDYQQALAIRDRAKVGMVSARIAQAEAQLRLVDEQLQRTRLRAPFAGVLVSGDLSRSLGAPVERGQPLFEIVPINDYHVSLEVDEHDVATLETGQQGSLRLTGLPEQLISVRISRILPVASADQGSNHFRVEAEMQNAPDDLRPGMQGVAKIVVGRGSLIDVWTHSLLDRLRLLVWSLGF